MWTNKNAMRPIEYNGNWLASDTTIKTQEIRRESFSENRMRRIEIQAGCTREGGGGE